MRGRGDGWEQGDLQAFIKLGSDDRNFYQYRAPARTTTWEPEFAIDLEVWRRLRADLESRWLSGAPPSGAAECGSLDVNAYVACEGPYLVHLADPGINPPNLAAVQEISAGIYRVAGTVAVPEAELWVDDIRVSSPVSEVGTAMALDARVVASDVGALSASFVRQDGQFHQINRDPTYRTTGTFQLATNWRLDRFLPTGLGLSVPLTVSYARSDVTPELLTGTDLRGESLQGLRKPLAWTSNYTLAVRRSTRGKSWLVRGLVDPFSVAGTYTQGRSRTELSDANSDAYAVLLGYDLQLKRRGPRLPFGGVIKGLPSWIRESEFGKGLSGATASLVPSNLRLGSGLTRNQADYSLFAVPVVRADDALITPTLSLTHLWRNSGGLTWQPLGMLALTGDLTSTRDLRVYPDSTSIGRLAYQERQFLLGVPVGVERDRTVTTSLALTPRLTSWLRPRYTTSSSFLLSRTLDSRPPVQVDGDSGAFILPQTLNNSRGREIAVALDLSRALRQIWRKGSAAGGGSVGFHLSDAIPSVTRKLGRTVLALSRLAGIGVDPAGAHGYGMVVDLGGDRYLAVGRGFRIELGDRDPEWQVGSSLSRSWAPMAAAPACLNGDETAGGTAILHPPVERTLSPFSHPDGLRPYRYLSLHGVPTAQP